ncbi:bifunctional folylpolyglutamate synthase/dihydrofolate synthase [Mesobacillus zeae]|uniref:Dihydrofolate synthase/folylpolyglutamate synthase n=1 Tax=Mesobacillus zeae TaxID=1917180 RepID=A0A398B5P7_9BACI|nr:folylpolyglutamate synthase/dihydrofolate synthase family protein [Mesobacillus zeae]RID83260.1 bifunctional folylpolyglutamate synthase/dihydrofolate synthase [Mesobacillus zeae]
MLTTYEEAVEWIHSRLRLGIKPGLLRMEWMMERLGNPEKKLRTIHVGGTNGKGSTVTFLRCILEEAGCSVGTFTSPYLEHFNERISMSGKPCGDSEIVKLVNVIRPLADELEKTELGGPTEFEVITAMSMYYFAFMSPVDVVIYEVGLGGRFDSTNIIHPLLSIITSIGRDHTAILGDTYGEIAFEKAGIIKDGVSIISGASQEEALAVIRKTAEDKKAPLYTAGGQFRAIEHTPLENGGRFTFSSIFKEYHGLEIGMIGKHQAENAALAVMACHILSANFSLPIEERNIRAGLLRASWPGRFEILSAHPLVVIDGAHNEEGIKALVSTLQDQYPGRKKTIMFAALKDKKFEKMIRDLDAAADRLVFTSFDFPRAASAEDLSEASISASKLTASDWRAGISDELKRIETDGMFVVTGSLYFLSVVKPYIQEVLNQRKEIL